MSSLEESEFQQGICRFRLGEKKVHVINTFTSIGGYEAIGAGNGAKTEESGKERLGRERPPVHSCSRNE